MSKILCYAGNVASYISSQSLLHVFSTKKIATCQKIEEKSTKTENVSFIGITFFTCEHFGGHIPWSATFVCQVLIPFSEHSETEISNPYLILRLILDRIYQYVVWLNVPMYHLLPLEKIQSKEHLFNYDTHIRLIEALVALECLEERAIRLIL